MYSLLIIIIILLIYLFIYYKYSYFNVSKVKPCNTCEEYYIHNEHINKKDAAKLMDEIVRRNDILLEYLRNKYINYNPEVKHQGNIMDISFGSDIGEVINSDRYRLAISQLITRYDPDNIYEISPLNTWGNTSYTENKKTLVLCLRKKDNENYELHNINTLMFVVLHELTHIANNEWGHEENFWILFKFLLENAVEIGIYKPVDYSKYPIVYCGLKLTYNPLYDNLFL